MRNQHQKHIHRAIKTPLVVLAYLTLGTSLSTAESKLESNSPFLPPGYSNKKPEPPKPVTQVNGPLSREIEFRGIVQMNGIYEFSLFNKKENRGYWVTENETAPHGIKVSDFDLDDMRITVTMNGRAEQLTLMTATDSPLPVAISTAKKPTNKPQEPNIPGLNTSNTKKPTSSRVIPRRRVILPKKQ